MSWFPVSSAIVELPPDDPRQIPLVQPENEAWKLVRYHVSSVAIAVAWLMFIVSFFLPATNVLQAAGTPPGTPLTGWQAFTTTALILPAQPLLVVAEPLMLLFLAFPLLNFAMLLAPLVASSFDRPAALSLILIPGGALPWVFPEHVTGQLFIGFYVWNASFFLMSAASLLKSIGRSHPY